MAASTSTAGDYRWDVFIHHSGVKLRKSLASHLHRRLLTHGLRVFLDLPELRQGEDLTSQINSAIRTARVHVAIFSPNYGRSKSCLNELVLMLEAGATIIPVYYLVNPVLMRPTDREDNGLYSEALQRHENSGTCIQTIESWRAALSCIADRIGFDLETYNGDEGILLDKVIETVLKKCKKATLNVFINHRGPDVKNTFASYLYHRLRYHGMQVFLDREELRGGDNLTSRIEDAIKSASVHVAIFSPRYAESLWCLKELDLMLQSGAPIIPVFYHVKPAELRWTTRVQSQLPWTKPKNGTYCEALHKLERKKRCDSYSVTNFTNALCRVANISGLDLETFKGDEGAMLEKLVEQLLELWKKQP